MQVYVATNQLVSLRTTAHLKMNVPSCCNLKPSAALLSLAGHKIIVPSSPLVQQDIHAQCS
jgi:hypothetical protein